MSTRAAVAMLTLQLRAAERELLEIESAERRVDETAARAQIRAKLEPLEAQRRAALDETYEQARHAAVVAVADARERAKRIRESMEQVRPDASAATAPEAAVVATTADAAVDDGQAETEEVEAVRVDAHLAANDVRDDRSADDIAADGMGEAVAQPDVVEALVPDAVVGPGALTPFAPPLAAAVQPAPTTVVIDAEAFARVFATVMAEAAERRGPGGPAAPGPAKQSFWSHARHPDVLLLGVATAIVLVVLFAWLA